MSIKKGREFVKNLNEMVNSKETVSRWSYIAYSYELFSDGDTVIIITGRRSELHSYLRISPFSSRLSTILKCTTFIYKNILNWIYRGPFRKWWIRVCMPWQKGRLWYCTKLNSLTLLHNFFNPINLLYNLLLFILFYLFLVTLSFSTCISSRHVITLFSINFPKVTDYGSRGGTFDLFVNTSIYLLFVITHYLFVISYYLFVSSYLLLLTS